MPSLPRIWTCKCAEDAPQALILDVPNPVSLYPLLPFPDWSHQLTSSDPIPLHRPAEYLP